jgi:hypothetical protein
MFSRKMKRAFSALATFSLVETVGRHPATAAGVLTLLGVGGGAGIAMFTPPTIVPFVSSNFNPNVVAGNTGNSLLPNEGTSGAMQFPSGGSAAPTNSAFLYGEMVVNSALVYNFNGEFPFANASLNANGNVGESGATGQPNFFFNRQAAGVSQTWWWLNPGPAYAGGGLSGNAGNSSYVAGLFPITAPTTPSCTGRQPVGVWLSNTTTFQQVDPGLGCPTGQPTLSAAQIASLVPGSGAQQATGVAGGTTCSATSGEMVVTASVAVAHGITPGMQYTMQGFTPTGYNVTYTALSGTTGTTLVGTPTTTTASCPAAVSAEGTALSGLTSSITFPPVSTTVPYNSGSTGITTRNNQHVCFWIVENGDDSNFPGSQTIEMSDDKGNALPGSPAVVPFLNQGFTSTYTSLTTGSSNALTISAIPSFTITNAVYSGATGFVTLTLSTSPSFIAGSEFTVSGITPSGYNQTYVAVAGTSSTTVVAAPLTGVAGTPNPFGSSPGTYSSGGSLVSVILPGQEVAGLSAFVIIMPYGTKDSNGTVTTGTGGTGTYALSSTPSSFSGSTTFNYGGFYYDFTRTARTAATIGDFVNSFGSGWGGSLGNVAMLWGKLPQVTPGTPSQVDLASICTKKKDIQQYAAAQTTAGNPIKVNALYRMNDLGIWGDSSYGTITGYLSAATGTSGGTATLNVVSTPYGSLALGTGTATANVTGVGMPVTTPATISLTTSSSSTYTITFPSGVTSYNLGSSSSPVTFAVGAWKPASPQATSTFKGYITTTGSPPVSTLHVTSFDNGTTHAGFESFTGTLGTTFIGSQSGNTLTVSSPSGSPPGNNAYIGVGTVISPAVGTSTLTQETVTALGSGVGFTGTYTVSVSQTIAASTTMFGSGQLPGPATNIQESGTQVGAGYATGMVISDGGASITGNPLLVTGVGSGVLTVAGNYYPSIASDTTMWATSGSIVPGEYILNSTATATPPVLNPVKVLGYSGACTIPGAYNGLLGCYTLSGSPNSTGAVGSSGTPVVFTGTTITDGGAIAPGPALTIKDQGPGITFPVNYGTGLGTLNLSGTYDTAVLGGTPTSIQALISNSANGLPVASCTPCNWSNLSSFTTSPFTFNASITTGGAMTVQLGNAMPVVGEAFTGSGYSGTITANTGIGTFTVTPSPGSAVALETMTATTVFKWSGSVAGIPGGGPYFVSVQAANGVGYVTMPQSVRVGGVYPGWGNGQAQSFYGTQAGNYTPWVSGLTGGAGTGNLFNFNEAYLTAPPVISNFVPAQSYSTAGDRFSANAISAESILDFNQAITNSLGVPASSMYAARDGIGMRIFTLGNVTQTQTVGVGDGSSLTWCSSSKFCAEPTNGVAAPATFNAASLTGVWFGGSATGTTLTVTTRYGGDLEPGMVLGVTGSPTVLYCMTGCTTPININGSTWKLSSAVTGTPTGTLASPLRADPPAAPASGQPILIPFGGSSTPWPNYNVQADGTAVTAFGGFGQQLIKAATFKIVDTDPATGIGTTVCQDTQPFAYNQTGGNCMTAGGTNLGFENYQTGDFQITFVTAPLSGHAITMAWTNLISPENIPGGNIYSRLQNLDEMGDGTPQSGFVSSRFAQYPGGVNGQMMLSQGSDVSTIMNLSAPAFVGYEYGAVGYSQMISHFFGVKFPALVPGSSPAVPLLSNDIYRVEVPLLASGANGSPPYTEQPVFSQWTEDVATSSTFSGTVSGSVLTETTNAVGAIPWEGMVLGCVTYNVSTCPIGPLSGTYITNLASGAWGVSGSTYNLSNSPGNFSTAAPLQNAVSYSGSGPAQYIGAGYDLLAYWNNGLAQTTSGAIHVGNGFTGGRRWAARTAAMIWCHNGGSCDDPKIDRVKANAGGCDSAELASPCFDDGSTYSRSYTPTSVTGKVLTFNGFSAHALPIVVGQNVTCSGCSGALVVSAVSNPPTQSTVAGQGQIGSANNGFTVTLSGSGTVPGGTPAYTFGCSGTSGVGSNCIDMAFSINVSGTFGTAAALDTCGANNITGNAPNYVTPNGVCVGNGIGELVRGFRIGTVQAMHGDGAVPAVGSVFDDGTDPANAQFYQSSAFTCNIVAAKVAQCVRGPLYASGVFSSVGQWNAGSTYVSYGDGFEVTGRAGSLLGYVGGQSYPFSSGGTGYSSGTVTAACSTVASGDILPKFDVTAVGGVIVNVAPANASQAVGLGIGGSCTLTPPTGTGFNSSGSITIQVGPPEGEGGIATFATDSNMTGMFLYDNSGESGNPLGTAPNNFFANGVGGYFEPGLPVRPFGQFQAERVGLYTAPCSQAATYLARTSGGNEGGNPTPIGILICGLVSDGVITGDLVTTGCGTASTSLDALYVLAQQNASDAVLNICGTNYTGTVTGTSTAFTPYTGFHGFNAAAGNYIATGFNATTATSPHFTQNSASYGVWPVSITNEANAVMGTTASNTAGESVMYANFTDGKFYARINNPATGGITSPGTKGLFVAERPSSASVIPYWDGIAQATQSTTSQTPENSTFVIGSTNSFAGTADTIAEAHIGGSLGATLNLALYNRLRTYMTAVGVP